MPLVMKIKNNYVFCRDRVFRATWLGCRRSRVRIKVESAGDLKILCILSSKWYPFRIREGYGSESWGMGCVFHILCPRNRGILTTIKPTITRLQEIFIFYASLHNLATIEYGK